jgi:hypothetical protein
MGQAPWDGFDLNREEKYFAHRTNIEQARELGFTDLSPSGFWGTDSGEHIAVCSICAALVHYPLRASSSEEWPVQPREYVKDTEPLQRHLASVHPKEDHGQEM